MLQCEANRKLSLCDGSQTPIEFVRVGASATTTAIKREAGKPCYLKIYIYDTVVVVYVNDDVALSTRAYDLHSRKFGLIVSDGEAAFENTKLYTL